MITYEEALKKALEVKWVLSAGWVETEEDIPHKWTGWPVDGPIIITQFGKLEEVIARHIIKLHNDSLLTPKE